MKKTVFTLALATFAGGYAMAQDAKKAITSIEIGSMMPMADIKMKSATGKETSLNDAKSRTGLIVMFSCNTCPYVIKSEARTKEVTEYAKSHGLGFIIINSNEAKRGEEDSYEAMVKYARKQGYDIPYVVDTKSQLADVFGATRTPEVFLFDHNGKLVYKGAMEDNPSEPEQSKEMYLQKAIDNMMAGSDIDPNTTKSIGCSIKRS